MASAAPAAISRVFVHACAPAAMGDDGAFFLQLPSNLVLKGTDIGSLSVSRCCAVSRGAGGSVETGRASHGSCDALTPVPLPVPRVHSPAGVTRPRAGRLCLRDAGGEGAHCPERAG